MFRLADPATLAHMLPCVQQQNIRNLVWETYDNSNWNQAKCKCMTPSDFAYRIETFSLIMTTASSFSSAYDSKTTNKHIVLTEIEVPFHLLNIFMVLDHKSVTRHC